jgi:hypothetical protein
VVVVSGFAVTIRVFALLRPVAGDHSIESEPSPPTALNVTEPPGQIMGAGGVMLRAAPDNVVCNVQQEAICASKKRDVQSGSLKVRLESDIHMPAAVLRNRKRFSTFRPKFADVVP